MLEHASSLSIAPLPFIEAFLPDFVRVDHTPSTCANVVAQSPSSGTLQLVGALVGKLDPDMPYDDWFRVGAAIYNMTNGECAGYSQFDTWSSFGDKYKGQSETRKLWRSLKPNHSRRVGMGTLVRYLRQAGFSLEDVQAELEPFTAADEEGA